MSKRYTDYCDFDDFGFDKYGYKTNPFLKRLDSRLAILGLQQPKNDKYSHPYSYDPFIVWFSDAKKGDNAVYSDRLWQWDYDKCQKCIDTVRANDQNSRFDNGNPDQVEKFLSLYYGKGIKLTAIAEGCNVSNGYPYWIFYFRD